MEDFDSNKSEKTCSSEKVLDSQIETTEQKVNDSIIEVKVKNEAETSGVVTNVLQSDEEYTLDQCVEDDNIDDVKVQNYTLTFKTVNSDLSKNEDVEIKVSNDVEVQKNIETCQTVANDLIKNEDIEMKVGDNFKVQNQTVDNDLTKNEDTEMKVSDDLNIQKNIETCQMNEVVEDESKGSNCMSFDEYLNNEANSNNTDENLVARSKSIEPIVKIQMPLCADYRSGSESDSIDSESDSPASTTESSTASEEDESDDSGTVKSGNFCKSKKLKTDLTLSDLPPIEDLKISVPEDACEEIGIVTSIVDALVVIESYKGTAALDIDTVLFLDQGKKTLGRIFEIFGPVTEPVYAVRFNNQEQINSLNIKKGLKIYYAPKTQHTSFVFLSEVMKNKGSDASWKDNVEAPHEFQDFSDDEEERKCKKGNKSEGSHDHNPSRKRPFQKTGQIVQPSRFKNPGAYHQGRFNAPRFIPSSRFRSPHSTPHCAPPNPPPQNFAYIPPYPGENFMNSYTAPLRGFFPPQFSGAPFPTFGVLPYGNFQQPFYQQRTHAFPGPPWHGPVVRPPPPPPPPPSQSFPPSTKDPQI